MGTLYRRLAGLAPVTALRASVITEVTFGHLRSARERASVDRAGQPIPWYTYPATHWLEQLDFGEAAVLEYGSGNSTKWWAKNAQRVVAMEDNPAWHKVTREGLPDSVDYRLVRTKREYVTPIESGTFDVIVIDGSHRPECARVAIAAVSPGGIIIFDNSDWYPKTVDFLRSSGVIQVDFVGLGPINPIAWATSIFIDVRAPFRFRHRAEISFPGRSTRPITVDY